MGFLKPSDQAYDFWVSDVLSLYLCAMKQLSLFRRAVPCLMVLTAWLLVGRVSAQDRHFSQFYASPLTMNPALTGAFNGKFRIAGIYRDQWRQAVERPFSTVSTALDFRFRVPGVAFSGDAFGVGLNFFRDEVRNFDFTSNEINLTGAYHKALDIKRRKTISAGFQAGLSQRNVNFNNLNFQDQFNQKDGYTFPTLENLPGNNITFGDLAAGINFSWVFKKNALWQTGIAMHHVNEPSVSFFPKDQGGDSRLYRRLQVHSSLILPFADNLYLSPRLHVLLQGPHRTLNAGANLRFLLNQYSGVALHTGLWGRMTGDVKSPAAMESATAFFGIEYEGMLLGMSYDNGLGRIANNVFHNGTFEISIGFVGEYEDEVVICPTF